ncbi:tetratricopeptide repeat protein [Teredinibacter turnerae]|uniref:tetratricopeptide repeat protein n=1 Tax=Teredinibacter turnerae TaxID=2426 RepID=UPI0004182827|nr:tetratricopeptide repeat protein [Teredinibacter turnerae]
MEHRHLTLMFTDIVGYSRLMGRDQVQTIAMLEDYRRILIEQIDKQQGTVVEFIGDAVFARFDTPIAGVTAAIEIQKALFSFNHFRDKSLPQLQTRIGLHCGEVATKNEAFFGDDVNIAARLEPIAIADGICISDRVYQAVKSELHEPVLALGVLPLKNIQSKVRGYLIRPLGITLRIRGHYLNRRVKEKLGAYRYPIAASIFMLIAAGIYFVPRWLVPGYDANYVEIADFQMLSNDQNNNSYLSSGISDAVRAQLADMKDLYVLKAGEGVQAPIVLTGSVQRFGDNLRVSYQIKRRDGDVQITGGKLDGKYNEIFILQDRLVGEIAKYLADEFAIPNFRPARLDTTSDILAYEYYMRGTDYQNRPSTQTNNDEAIKYFTTALVHDNEYVDAEAALCEAYKTKYVNLGDVSWFNSAKQHCELALKLDPTHTGAIRTMAAIHRQSGEYDQAIQLIDQVLAREPDNTPAARLLALTYHDTNESAKAIGILEDCIQRHPKDFVNYKDLARIYLDNGNLEEAITNYKKVLEITPQNNAALNNLGIAYYYLGELKQARKYFELATRLIQGPGAYGNLGSLNYFLGDYDKAAEQFKIALAMSPTDALLQLNYADSLRNTNGKSGLAEESYNKAIALAKEIQLVNPEDSDANITLALSYLALHNPEQAKPYLRKAELGAPDYPEVIYVRLRYHIATGNFSEAFATLSELLDAGYSKAILERDPDLVALHNQPDFKTLLAHY